jgi:hypothetical protein
MAKGGKKYRLLLYEHMLNRWWPATLWLALIPLINVGVLWSAQWYFTNPADNPLPVLSDQEAIILFIIAGVAFLFTIFLLIARKMAYIQLFADHMLLATPFMRLKISYKRIQRSTTTQVAQLFPPKSMSGHKREIIGPISGNTAIVLHLKSYPMPRSSMKLFLSPFFFYDQTPHFVLVVEDWMKFSTELESRRVSGKVPNRPPHPHSRSAGLLDDLKRK